MLNSTRLDSTRLVQGYDMSSYERERKLKNVIIENEAETEKLELRAFSKRDAGCATE
jgi:hypothetical protein